MECSICLERFNNEANKPLVLECGHTFCQACVTEIYNKSKRECPIDRSKMTQPLKKVKINYTVQDIIASLTNISLSSPAKLQDHSDISSSSLMELDSPKDEKYLACPQGHVLVSLTNFYQSAETGKIRVKCSHCGTNESIKTWTCLDCQFNLCEPCAEDQKNCSALDSDYPLLCDNSHILFFYKNSDLWYARQNNDRFLKCLSCEKIWKGGSWSCRICKFDLCTSCVDKSQLSVNLQCNRLHFLQMIRKEIGNSAVCSVCKIVTSAEGFTCKPCKFFMCVSCADYFNRSLFLRVTCVEGHGLVHSDDQVGLYFIRTGVRTFTCNGCGKVCGNVKNFHCRRCDFDLCDMCYGSIVQGISNGFKAKCRAKHELLWFYDTCKVYKGKITCDLCNRAYAKCGSFHCRVCMYDVCLVCAGSFINR